MNDTCESRIDPPRFHDLMVAVCAPVTAVTTTDEATPRGATVNSFAPISAEPPLVTIALDPRSVLLAHILRAERFGMYLLGHSHAALPTLFAQRGTDRVADTRWPFDHGLPRLYGATGWVVCAVHNVADGGDHELILGHVKVVSRHELSPLSYAHRTLGRHSRYHQRHGRRSSTRSPAVPAQISS